jgi:hypothetical protein
MLLCACHSFAIWWCRVLLLALAYKLSPAVVIPGMEVLSCRKSKISPSMSMKEKHTSELGLSAIAPIAAVSVIPGVAVVDAGRGFVGPVIVY